MNVTAFLGDGERTFALPRPQIEELERRRNAGIGVIFNRLIAREFSFADLAETIRLALIGGGATPQEAARLVSTYVDARPIAETMPIAIAVLDMVWFGRPADEPTDPAPDTVKDAARSGDMAAALNEVAA